MHIVEDLFLQNVYTEVKKTTSVNRPWQAMVISTSSY